MKKKTANKKVVTAPEAEQNTVLVKDVVNAVANKKVGVKLAIKRDVLVKVAVGIIAALILIPVLDWVIQTTVTSQYAAFYKGSDVTRSVYIKELEKQYGTQVIQELVAKAAINQAAADKDLTISDADLDKAIEADKTKAGITTDEAFQTALAQSGLTLEDYRDYVRITALLDKLLEGTITTPTDEELKSYFDTNKDLYTGKTFEDVKASISEQIMQTDLNTKRQAWIDNALKNYDVKNNLVTEKNGDYGFLKSIDLVARLFSSNPNTK